MPRTVRRNCGAPGSASSSDVEQQTGRAHGRERARGHHVDFTGGFFRAHAPDGLGHFLSVEDNGPAFFDALVDFRDCLDNLMIRHNIFPRQLVGSLGGRRSVLLPLTYTRYKGKKDTFKPWDFTYNVVNDSFVCPEDMN